MEAINRKPAKSMGSQVVKGNEGKQKSVGKKIGDYGIGGSADFGSEHLCAYCHVF